MLISKRKWNIRTNNSKVFSTKLVNNYNSSIWLVSIFHISCAEKKIQIAYNTLFLFSKMTKKWIIFSLIGICTFSSPAFSDTEIALFLSFESFVSWVIAFSFSTSPCCLMDFWGGSNARLTSSSCCADCLLYVLTVACSFHYLLFLKTQYSQIKAN